MGSVPDSWTRAAGDRPCSRRCYEWPRGYDAHQRGAFGRHCSRRGKAEGSRDGHRPRACKAGADRRVPRSRRCCSRPARSRCAAGAGTCGAVAPVPGAHHRRSRSVLARHWKKRRWVIQSEMNKTPTQQSRKAEISQEYANRDGKNSHLFSKISRNENKNYKIPGNTLGVILIRVLPGWNIKVPLAHKLIKTITQTVTTPLSLLLHFTPSKVVQ